MKISITGSSDVRLSNIILQAKHNEVVSIYHLAMKAGSDNLRFRSISGRYESN